jgi:hypothetical protein
MRLSVSLNDPISSGNDGDNSFGKPFTPEYITAIEVDEWFSKRLTVGGWV